MHTLPPPRTPGRYAVALVCLGNICRSPMAHVVLQQKVAAAGLADRVAVTSSGTGNWHVGEPMDSRAAATLRAHGYDPSGHRARQFDAARNADLDLVLAMDHANLAAVGGLSERSRLFREVDPAGTGDEVPDPYYGGEHGFEEVLAMVERTTDALVSQLPAVLDDVASEGPHQA